ncbi:MAG: hypothetical protein RsTaC01_0515 [Candidatus Paraimprobicoccus trichonymphae]|uniref:Uncharacterized protein n=1 Tax=Candidatus Paraimprobicoccus trichonymphae TaxID=3033793 RepID=A0AA48IHD7_9FIRM|nr:MAG: hypothetical protein RsTaC01_0515 [Candidatus Paraimprobicoccus trichonymphae]
MSKLTWLSYVKTLGTLTIGIAVAATFRVFCKNFDVRFGMIADYVGGMKDQVKNIAESVNAMKDSIKVFCDQISNSMKSVGISVERVNISLNLLSRELITRGMGFSQNTTSLQKHMAAVCLPFLISDIDSENSKIEQKKICEMILTENNREANNKFFDRLFFSKYDFQDLFVRIYWEDLYICKKRKGICDSTEINVDYISDLRKILTKINPGYCSILCERLGWSMLETEEYKDVY